MQKGGVGVLIVEDSPTQAERLRLILEHHGYESVVARNGSEAIQLFSEGVFPALVISDIVMPVMNGYQLCAHIKKDPALRNIPVILLTSLTDPSDVMRGLECGADNFIFKPYEEEYLVARVNYVLANRHLRETDTTQMGLQIHFAGAKYFINSDRLQILNLLLSTYEAAIAKNRELAEATAELEAKNLQLAGEIAERVRIEELLVAAKVEAERANSSKSEFLSHMSHELRTPLNAIIGFSQLLLMKSEDPLVTKSANSILDGGRHLLTLINEILDIARIEAGRLAITIESLEAKAVIGQTVELVEPIANERGIKLNVRTEGCESIYVSADRLRLVQVLLNLLTNAVKYNRPSGEVTVSCRSEDGRAFFIIEDTGVGINAATEAALFEPFIRGENEGEEGTGLGLALSLRLVNLMGGNLELARTSDEGSTFVASLMLTDAPSQNGTSAAQLDADQDPAGGSLRVVYIEDNDANMQLMKHIFEGIEDAELIPAMLAKTGLEIVQATIPDLVILDLHLPDAHGYDVLVQLKANPATENIPVIVLSADATDTQIKRLMSAGATAYLTKPLDIAALYDSLNGIRSGSAPSSNSM